MFHYCYCVCFCVVECCWIDDDDDLQYHESIAAERLDVRFYTCHDHSSPSGLCLECKGILSLFNQHFCHLLESLELLVVFPILFVLCLLYDLLSELLFFLFFGTMLSMNKQRELCIWEELTLELSSFVS